jgi:hypothetical protein
MMNENEIHVKMLDKSIDVMQVASWVKWTTGEQFTSADRLCIARCLLSGERWSPLSSYFDVTKANSYPHWDVTVTNAESDRYTNYYKEQQGYFALMRKGAEGDAEAAIAYCKLEAEGKVNHGAMA